MSHSEKVNAFMSKLDHPLKAEMEAIRAIIVGANSKIEEDVKWGGPSFDFKEPMATFNPRVKDYVAVIFHKGELLQDDSGLLEKGPKGRAYAKFYNMKEVETHKATLENLVNDWVKLMDQ